MKKPEANKESVAFTDEYLDFVSQNASKIKISEKNKSSKVFEDETPTSADGSEEITIISDEGIDYITANAKKFIIAEENKVRRLRLEFTTEEQAYLDTHDNSISGEIRNFTDDDLKIFNKPKGDL